MCQMPMALQPHLYKLCMLHLVFSPCTWVPCFAHLSSSWPFPLPSGFHPKSLAGQQWGLRRLAGLGQQPDVPSEGVSPALSLGPEWGQRPSVPLGMEWDTVYRWETVKESEWHTTFGVCNVILKASPSWILHRQFMLTAGEINVRWTCWEKKM